jgi:MoaA/NifB/PqqE/SkfB family radical SAM enzyme
MEGYIDIKYDWGGKMSNLRYDYLLHATVKADEDWGFQRIDTTGLPDKIEELKVLHQLYAKDISKLTEFKRINYLLVQKEAQKKTLNCTSRPFNVQVSRDEHCNLSCIYCRPTKSIQCNTMPKDVWLKIVPVLLSPAVEFMPFCWGEPLIAPDFDLMCAIAKEYKTSISLITNLQYLNPKLASLFVNNITRALISIDSADSMEFSYIRRKGSLEKLEHNIDLLKYVALKEEKVLPWLGLSVVLMKRNLETLPKLIHWAIDHSINGIYVGRLVINNKIMDFGKNELVDFNTNLYNDIYIECEKLCHTSGIELSMYNPNDFLGLNQMCPCPWEHVYLSASGDLSFCNFSRLRLIGKYPFDTNYWNESSVLAKRNLWNNEYRCPECQSTDYDGRPNVTQYRGY